MNFSQILILCWKEFLLLVKDPKARVFLVGPPLLQLLIFAYAATLEVKNAVVGVCNCDGNELSQNFVDHVASAPWVGKMVQVFDISQIAELIEKQEILAGVIIPQDFSSSLFQSSSLQSPTILIALDGRKANASQIVAGYLQNICDHMNTELTENSPVQNSLTPIVKSRFWFNPNLDALWGTVPALVAIISLLMGFLVTALSIAREKEMGTLDCLFVAPLTPLEVLIGKAGPAFIVGIAQALFMTFVGSIWLGVPFQGRLLPLIFICGTFIYSVIGLGLLISCVARNQQQAIIGIFFLMVPCVTLSGYAAPIENMPTWLQYCSLINPLRYGLLGIRGVFLKNLAITLLMKLALILVILGTALFSIAHYVFSQKWLTSSK